MVGTAMSKPALLAALAAAQISPQRDSLINDIDAGFFDDILGGHPPVFEVRYSPPPSVPDMRDYIPSPRSTRGFKVGGSSKQHHTTKRSKDARKARAATRQNRK